MEGSKWNLKFESIKLQLNTKINGEMWLKSAQDIEN